MKIGTLCFLFLTTSIVCVRAEMKSEKTMTDELLKSGLEHFQKGWLGAAITPTELVQESERRWKKYMQLFVENLKRHGLASRPDIIASKEQVHAAWKAKREVFLLHLQAEPKLRIYRFDGGKGNPCGYVLMDDEKPFRWLTVRVNRPDPNIGNVELPFP